MAYKYKIRGVVKQLDSDMVREVEFNNGSLTGDLILLTVLQDACETYELAGEFENGYSPETINYAEDALAVIFIMHDICENVQIAGTYPKWDISGEEGVELY